MDDAWWVASLRRLPVGDVGHGRHDVRGHARSAGELVRGDLVRGQPEAGCLGARASAGVLGLGSYETAWAWLHKLRRAMVLPGRELLCGAVEIDETYVGARHTSVGGRSLGHKTIVLIAVEGDQAPDRVRMRRVPNVKRDTLTDFVLDHVARGSEVRTDAWTAYDDVGRYRFQHVVTNLSQSGDPAHVLVPHVQLVASLLKRWILGTHQGAVSHTQLDYYLDEFTFRFNRRRARHRGLLFYRLLQGAVVAEPHPYKTLTSESTE